MFQERENVLDKNGDLTKVRDKLKSILENEARDLSYITGKAKEMGISDTTVRGTLYRDNEFINVVGTVWTLEENKYKLTEEIVGKLIDCSNELKRLKRNNNITPHRLIQSVLIKIGKESGYTTYIPSQDKGFNFNEYEKLGDIVDIYELPEEIDEKKKIRTIDVIWFTKENKIKYLFEVEGKDAKKIKNKIKNYRSLHNNGSKMYIISNLSPIKVNELLYEYKNCNEIRETINFVEIDNLIEFYENWNMLKKDKCFNISIN